VRKPPPAPHAGWQFSWLWCEGQLCQLGDKVLTKALRRYLKARSCSPGRPFSAREGSGITAVSNSIICSLHVFLKLEYFCPAPAFSNPLNPPVQAELWCASVDPPLAPISPERAAGTASALGHPHTSRRENAETCCASPAQRSQLHGHPVITLTSRLILGSFP